MVRWLAPTHATAGMGVSPGCYGLCHCIVCSAYCIKMQYLCVVGFVTTKLVYPQEEESARTLGVLDVGGYKERFNMKNTHYSVTTVWVCGWGKLNTVAMAISGGAYDICSNQNPRWTQKPCIPLCFHTISGSDHYSMFHSNQNPRWTQKTCIPLRLHTISGSDYQVTELIQCE